MKREAIRKLSINLNRILLKTYMFIYKTIKGVQTNKVVFMSFAGKTYSDNPRAISEALHEKDKSMEIIWLFNEPEKRSAFVPDYVKMVKLTRISQLREHATANVWVDNFTKPLYFFKGPEQLYIQTWHGDRGFKKVLYDSTFISKDYEILESDICDIMVSGSDFCDHVYRSAFRYEGEIFKVGSPRNDALIRGNPSLYQSIRQKYHLDESIKILLYAPTLRRSSMSNGELQDTSEIDLGSALDILEHETEEEWRCFVRAHVSVTGLSGVPDDRRFIDVTAYEDMADILIATDFLITDYSSSAGDFILQNRPVILYQNDRSEYVERDRTFYFELDECPYHMVQTQKELEKEIPLVLKGNITKNCKEILDFYNTIESGTTSEQLADRIISHCNK